MGTVGRPRARAVTLVLAGSLTLGANARPAHADDAPARTPDAASEEAKRHFTAGVNLLRDPVKPRYEEAYREFKAAHAASGSPKVLGNLALCAMMLERDAEAIAAYEAYLKAGLDLDAQERAQIERDLFTLRAGIARVTVSANVPSYSVYDTRLPVQGESLTNVYGPFEGETELGVRQGRHVLRAKAPGRADVVWEVETTGAALPPHAFVFEDAAAPAPAAPAPDAPAAAALAPLPPPSARRPVGTPVWIGAGVTGALGIATLATGVAALSAKSSYDDANDGRSPETAASDRGSGRTLNAVTDVLLVGTLVAAGVTTYLFLTRPEEPPPAAARWLGGRFVF